MANGKYVAYYRVSTAAQGKSGLGLEAQQAAVHAYLNGGSWALIKELTEVESGKRDINRPQLIEALRLCRLNDATLVVAKLDRLSRDAAFLITLQNSSVPFVAADMPGANNFTVGIMALVAQQEREAISARTKAALAAAKARGVRLGGDRGHVLPSGRAAAVSAAVRSAVAMKRAQDVLVSIEQVRSGGATSLRAIADALNEQGVTAPLGGAWQAGQVRRILERAASVN